MDPLRPQFERSSILATTYSAPFSGSSGVVEEEATRSFGESTFVRVERTRRWTRVRDGFVCVESDVPESTEESHTDRPLKRERSKRALAVDDNRFNMSTIDDRAS